MKKFSLDILENFVLVLHVCFMITDLILSFLYKQVSTVVRP